MTDWKLGAAKENLHQSKLKIETYLPTLTGKSEADKKYQKLIKSALGEIKSAEGQLIAAIKVYETSEGAEALWGTGPDY
ncbi:hypothetical protein LCGC14_0302890 [marine sediment metagenome]|uniref:Uncharacterized protein n=1 Tax=marine sediment metagenome TaxID=412755 RepID=A0A0F9U6S5_9ZZZZ